MSIVFDTASAAQTGTGSMLSWSHTVTGYSNSVLVVGVGLNKTAADVSVSGITYNGVALTQAVGLLHVFAGAGSHMDAELWYLVNPPTGAHTVSVTLTGAPDEVDAGSASYGSVDTGSLINGTNTNNISSGTDIGVAVTTLSGGWAIGCCISAGGGDYDNSTDRWREATGSYTAGQADRNNTGSTNLNWHKSSAGVAVAVAFALNPFTGSAGASKAQMVV